MSSAPWSSLEEHLDGLKERVDHSVSSAHELREKYREELLAEHPEITEQIRRPSSAALTQAEQLLSTGTVAPVPLLGGTKIQVGVVIVFNHGEVVDLVTRVFETELVSETSTATEFFSQLREARSVSNLLSRAIMLFGERRLLLDQPADWRMIHGELIPHELRTGAGMPAQTLAPTFELIHGYIDTETFIAVSEGSDETDILNAAILLEPGEYI